MISQTADGPLRTAVRGPELRYHGDSASGWSGSLAGWHRREDSWGLRAHSYGLDRVEAGQARHRAGMPSRSVTSASDTEHVPVAVSTCRRQRPVLSRVVCAFDKVRHVVEGATVVDVETHVVTAKTRY